MKIEFYNTPQPQPLNTASLPEAPAFLSYQPDFASMQTIAEEFHEYKNLIIIGHGGSITSFQGIYYSLQEQSSKEVYFLNTIDPDYIAQLKSFLMPIDTLVIAISKSGETVTQIEAMLQFTDFPLLFITGSIGPLAEIAEKLSAKLVLHPAIGGRYTGLTEVALLPAALCGLNVKAMYDAAKKWYQQFSKDNPAYQAASIFQQLEDKGFVDVFLPIYDAHLFPFSSLIVQLCHESFGKDGEGQTYFSHSAPESQHHTNQRFFGGRKNIAGWFISVEQPQQQTMTVVPSELGKISIKEHQLSVLGGIPLNVALDAELQGTLEDAKLQNIPVVHQTIAQRTPTEIGSLIAFWQMYAVYSSLLRNVDPFDQPQVENSKKISFDKRLQFKGLL